MAFTAIINHGVNVVTSVDEPRRVMECVLTMTTQTMKICNTCWWKTNAKSLL